MDSLIDIVSGTVKSVQRPIIGVAESIDNALGDVDSVSCSYMACRISIADKHCMCDVTDV